MVLKETIGLMLVREGTLTRPQLNQGLRAHRTSGCRLGEALIKLGFIDLNQLLEVLSRQLSLPILPRDFLLSVAPAVVGRCPESVARHLGVMPVTASEDRLAFAIPNGAALPALRAYPAFAGHLVEGYLASEEAINDAHTQWFGVAETASTRAELSVDPTRPRPPHTGFDAEAGEGEEPPRILEAVIAPPDGGTLPAGPLEEVLPLELDAPDPSTVPQRLFDGETVNQIMSIAGEALGEFFRRVLVGWVSEEGVSVVGHRGFDLRAVAAPLHGFPALARTAVNRSLSYGAPGDDRRALEVVEQFLPRAPKMALVGTLGAGAGMPVVLYGDNDQSPPIYDDLHEVEMLFKEVETALLMLNIRVSPL